MMNIRDMPMWFVGGVVVVLGAGFLAWHAYARDDDDTDWLDPEQPPAQMMMPLTPAAHGSGCPMGCGPAFRSRRYPDMLAAAGELGVF